MSVFNMSASARSLAHVFLVIVLAMLVLEGPFPSAASPADDERYVERDSVYSSPGIHELATNLLAQLRQNSLSARGADRWSTGCGFPSAAKRNSELINSLLGLPKQVSNGRK